MTTKSENPDWWNVTETERKKIVKVAVQVLQGKASPTEAMTYLHDIGLDVKFFTVMGDFDDAMFGAGCAINDVDEASPTLPITVTEQGNVKIVSSKSRTK